ncbi:Spc98 family-domain-containing protein [Podospora australis]|uniref:Spindle pole body component n=1 Tax=Podospora australis TaxID=1536484 RepID=A0AAN7AP54_9PEZI|nr:Spc98 family-domain-containing protein [Podospora australis]
MATEEDLSDLFAIPDFWRPSNWLDQSIIEINRQNPLFTFGVSGTINISASYTKLDSISISIDEDREENEDRGAAFFKLPPVLQELTALQQPQLPDLGINSGRLRYGPEPTTLVPQKRPLEEDDDVWLLSGEDVAREPEFKTWESFDQNQTCRSSASFITEAGPTAFDALLAAARGQDPNDPATVPDILDNAVYSACLLTLALGRSSLSFSWNSDKNSFIKIAPHLRTSGISLDLTKAVDRLCLDCGNCIRHLQYFAETTYTTASTPTRVAFAGVIARLVTTVGSELSTRSRNIRSILQLQHFVQPVQQVLSYFKELVKKVAPQKSDEAMLSCLFQEVQAAEYRDELVQAATCEVLRIVSRPWTDFVEEWLGLRAEDGIPITKKGAGKGFVKVADKIWIDDHGFELDEPDYFLDEDKVPSFVPKDMAQTIFETGRNLRFLREHHQDHPLSRPDVVALTVPPKLEWEFDWDAISKLEARVNQYWEAVSQALRGTLQSNNQEPDSSAASNTFFETEFSVYGKSEEQVTAGILASMAQLNQPLSDGGPRDSLTLLIKDRLYQRSSMSSPSSATKSEHLSPHKTLVPLLSFGPIINAQSRLINHECMKLLFTSHHLQVHFDLLKQYFLLGNGLLVSRLSHALFDPELSTAERKAGVALGGGMMGLRLGGRQTWPPASSELRLALMGVLADCYLPSPSFPQFTPARNSNNKSDTTQLPGDLSFAVRDLSQDEIDRCMNPDSLEALDFLRLSYKPPSPLRPVLTPTILLKYDRIFKLLLRVLRMLYVGNDLYRFSTSTEPVTPSNVTTRFCVEARHFIRQIASYFFDTGITAPWDRFAEWLDSVQQDILASNSTQENVKNTISPDTLKNKQDDVLDEIMSVLLLRKRQAPVLKLLEEVFGIVLKFAKLLRLRRVEAHLGHSLGEQEERELYKAFRRKVEVFITVCRGLSEKVGSGKVTFGVGAMGGRGGARENTIEQLLVRLDRDGFYGKRGGVGGGG